LNNYRRNIEKRLFSLRLILFLTGGICFYFLATNQLTAGYSLVVLLLIFSFIPVRDVVISSDTLTARHYFFFGIVQREWVFKKGAVIRVSSYDPAFGEKDDFTYPDDLESGLGCFYFLFTSIKAPVIRYREFTVRETDSSGNEIKKVKLWLNKEEYAYLQKIVDKSFDTH
jgi:hypothetical protein